METQCTLMTSPLGLNVFIPFKLVLRKQASTSFTHGEDRTAFIDSKKKSLTPAHAQEQRQEKANSPRPADLRPREHLLYVLTKLLPPMPCSILWLPRRNTYFQLWWGGGRMGELYFTIMHSEQSLL